MTQAGLSAKLALSFGVFAVLAGVAAKGLSEGFRMRLFNVNILLMILSFNASRLLVEVALTLAVAGMIAAVVGIVLRRGVVRSLVGLCLCSVATVLCGLWLRGILNGPQY